MEEKFSRHRQSEGERRNAGAESGVTLAVASIAGPGKTMLDPCQARMGLRTAESHSQHWNQGAWPFCVKPPAVDKAGPGFCKVPV